MAGPLEASSNLDSPLQRQEVSKLFYLGLFLYLISFFLPAVWSADHFTSGWICAYLTLGVWLTSGFGDPAYQWGVRLTMFGGLINLLAIAYAILTLPHRLAPKARFIIAVAVVTCMPPMWLSLYLLDSPPYVGHAVWIIGLLLMISGDISVLGRRRLLRIAIVMLSFVLALVTHGVIISRDPLAQGPSLWGFTLERNHLSGEPLLLGLFREFPSKTVNPVTLFLSLLIDCLTWLIVLVAVSKLIQKLWETKLSAESA